MTLTKEIIKGRLSPNSNINKRIIITPILDLEKQLTPCGVDVRLGHQFIVFHEHIHGSLNPNDTGKSYLRKYQEEIIIPFAEKIVLHPGQFLIGSTLEYISIPSDIECQVEGRSSWARLGLIIATATTVEPLFKGVITLELSNNGTIPIELYPGLRIAQLIFHETGEIENSSAYSGKYLCPIGPGYSRLYFDDDLKIFIGINGSK